MIDQNYTHTDYDRDLELLRTLPCWPGAAPLGELRDDLFPEPYLSRRPTLVPVRKAIERLRVRFGIEIHIRRALRPKPGPSGDEAGIDTLSWDRAHAVAQVYANRVYGDGDTPLTPESTTAL